MDSEGLFLRNYGHSHHRIYNLRFYRIHSLMDYRVWRRYCSDGLCEYNFDFEYLEWRIRRAKELRTSSCFKHNVPRTYDTHTGSIPSKLQRNSSNSPTLLLFRLKDNYQNDPHQRVANTGTLRLHISTASESFILRTSTSFKQCCHSL